MAQKPTTALWKQNIETKKVLFELIKESEKVFEALNDGICDCDKNSGFECALCKFSGAIKSAKEFAGLRTDPYDWIKSCTNEHPKDFSVCSECLKMAFGLAAKKVGKRPRIPIHYQNEQSRRI